MQKDLLSNKNQRLKSKSYSNRKIYHRRSKFQTSIISMNSFSTFISTNKTEIKTKTEKQSSAESQSFTAESSKTEKSEITRENDFEQFCSHFQMALFLFFVLL